MFLVSPQRIVTAKHTVCTLPRFLAAILLLACIIRALEETTTLPGGNKTVNLCVCSGQPKGSA